MSGSYFIEIFESDEDIFPLDEGNVTLALQTALSAIPWVGSAYDVVLVLYHLRKAKKAETEEDRNVALLYAALSLVSVIPAVGDIIGQGGKFLLKKGVAKRAGQRAVLTSEKIKELQALIHQHKGKIRTLFATLGEVGPLKPYARDMEQALEGFARGEAWVQQATPPTLDELIQGKVLRGREISLAKEWRYYNEGKATRLNFICGNCGDHVFVRKVARGPQKIREIKVKDFEKPIVSALCYESCGNYNVFPKGKGWVDIPKQGRMGMEDPEGGSISLLMRGDPSGRATG